MGQKQNEWMSAFEAAMCARNPTWVGLIDWQIAKEYYRACHTPEVAAKLYESNAAKKLLR